jgi:hypothetical protein
MSLELYSKKLKELKMKRVLVLFGVLAVVFGCSKQGEFKVINRCDHPAYYIVKGEQYTLEGNTSKTHDVKMDSGMPLTSPDKTLELTVWGDTYFLYEQFSTIDTLVFSGPQTTNIKVTHDEQLKLYLNPNRACIEVTNTSSQPIDNIIAYRANETDSTTVIFEHLNSEPIYPNETQIVTLFANPLVVDDNGTRMFPYYFTAVSDNTTIDSIRTTLTGTPIILDYDDKFIWTIDGE